jgi:GntR family phosphonate transport system transcriptional regulator
MSLYAVSRGSGEPLYLQIARQLEQEIGPLYEPGQALPPEGELALRFGVNRHTLRHAIDELIDAGLVERRHGRGVFVTDAPLDYPLGSATRFTEALSAHGLATDSRVLRCQTVPANEAVAGRLQVARAQPVIWLETLRSADFRPFCLSSHFLPASRFEQVARQYDGGSLHDFLLERYGCRLRRTESLVTSQLPQGDDAQLLRMPQNRPVLRVKSVNVDSRDGLPVEYVITRFRADRVQLRITP